MNARDQTRQAVVTCSCPFCDSSCKFVYRPENGMSINSHQIQAFQKNLRAHFGHISDRLQIFLLKVVMIQCSVFLLANSQYLSTHLLACPPMSQDHEETLRFSEYGNFSVAPAEIQDSNMVLYLSTISLLVWHCL